MLIGWQWEHYLIKFRTKTAEKLINFDQMFATLYGKQLIFNYWKSFTAIKSDLLKLKMYVTNK